MKSLTVIGKVWIYPGVGGWHFINIDKDTAAKIKKVAKTYGAGFVKIKATLGKTSWATALFPQTKTGTYLLSIKAAVRKKEDVWAGDNISITIELI
jgi:hypothetical protein